MFAIGLFFEGLLAFLSPCILPLLPVYLAYMAGDRLRSRPQRLLSSLCFVLGFSLVFVGLGLAASSLGQLLRDELRLLRHIAAGFLILIACFYLLGQDPLGRVLSRLGCRSTEGPQNTGTYLSSFVLGLSFSISWTPCVGPLLASALTLALSSGNSWASAGLLLSFSLGLGLPFVLLSLLYERLRKQLRFLQQHSLSLRRIGGLLLLVLGILMLSGSFERYLALFN